MAKTKHNKHKFDASALYIETAAEDFRKWWHKPHYQLLLGVVFLLVAVVTAQCFYPYDRAFPNARVGNLDVSNLERDAIIDKLRSSYGDVPLSIAIPGVKPIESSTVKAGITPKYSEVAVRASEYSLNERLIPFSSVTRWINNQVSVPYEIENERFSAFSQEVGKQCLLAPVDASLKFEKGTAKLVSAVPGQKCQENDIRRALSATTLNTTEVSVWVRPTPVLPARSNEQLQPYLTEAQQILEAGITLATASEKWQVPPEVIAGWLSVEEVDGSLRLTTKNDAVKAYLEAQRGRFYIEPGTTTVTVIDGREVARAAGRSGQGIETDITVSRIKEALLGTTSNKTAWLELTVLPVKEVVARDYTNTPAGMQAMIEQWDRDNSGRYGIIVRDLSGKDISASLNPDRDFITASTYKMFLAYAALNRVENGSISMETGTDIGLSVRDCIEEMILHSTNACAVSLMNLLGWGEVHGFIKSQFPSTSLDNGQTGDGEKHTTVNDEITFLERLNAGQLMNQGNSDYLLGLLKRQVYRSGIPLGVTGVVVANKVGFYAGYKHDVAIIYSPRGTYLLGIMSLGGNDGKFADLSRKVHELLNR